MRKPGKKGKTAGKITVFLLIFLLLFVGAEQVLQNKNSAGSIRSLYAEKRDSLDVVFIGSSHLLNAIYPMQLWEEYGIVSNNLAQHGQSIPLSYYMAEEAIRVQHPDMIVLDVYMMYYTDMTYEGDGSTHKSIDNLHWGSPKLGAILNVVNREDRLDYFLNITLYHTRWKELTAEDFAPVDVTGKGCELRFGCTPCQTPALIGADEVCVLPDNPLTYFAQLTQLCEETDTRLLLVCMPFAATTEKQQAMNAVGKLAEEYDLPFVNYLYLDQETGFDYTTDLYDESHVNPEGGEKLTAHLGALLAEEYSLPDHRGQAAYQDWEANEPAWESMTSQESAETE